MTHFGMGRLVVLAVAAAAAASASAVIVCDVLCIACIFFYVNQLLRLLINIVDSSRANE